MGVSWGLAEHEARGLEPAIQSQGYEILNHTPYIM
jgi:hypothetical protein